MHAHRQRDNLRSACPHTPLEPFPCCRSCSLPPAPHAPAARAPTQLRDALLGHLELLQRPYPALVDLYDVLLGLLQEVGGLATKSGRRSLKPQIERGHCVNKARCGRWTGGRRAGGASAGKALKAQPPTQARSSEQAHTPCPLVQLCELRPSPVPAHIHTTHTWKTLRASGLRFLRVSLSTRNPPSRSLPLTALHVAGCRGAQEGRASAVRETEGGIAAMSKMPGVSTTPLLEAITGLGLSSKALTHHGPGLLASNAPHQHGARRGVHQGPPQHGGRFV